jgi:hypothetical protein
MRLNCSKNELQIELFHDIYSIIMSVSDYNKTIYYFKNVTILYKNKD